MSFAVGGIGTAAQIGNGYPLLTRLAPAQRVGLFTGVDAALASITAPVAGVLMGSLLDAFGYDVLFPTVAALYFVALVPLALLRVAQSLGNANVMARSSAPQAQRNRGPLTIQL